jgi:lysozyme
MKIGKKGLDLIKHFEGFKNKAYLCPAGVWTIGYGTTKNVKKGDTVTLAQAEIMIAQDVAESESYVNKLVKVPITQDEFDALVAFVYNVGAGNFKSSTLLKKLNKGDHHSVPEQMLRWNKGGGMILAGLTRRRTSEGTLFATGKLKF